MSPTDATPTGEVLMLRLPAGPLACVCGRHAVRDLCRSQSLDRMTDDAQLLTSELISNAVRYASSEVTLRASSKADGLTVTVVDDGEQTGPNAGGLLAPPMPNTAAERGRGLFLLDQLAADWGSTEHSVWFRLA